MPRLEVKWWTPARSVDLKQILDNYLKELQKKSKKNRAPVEFRTDVRLVSRRQLRKAELIGFTWSGHQAAWGVGWRCEDCGRVVVAQVLGAPDENVRPLAEKVVSSMTDHSPDGWDVWGVYGFIFEIPDDFALEKQRLLTGHLEFRFTRGKTKTFGPAGEEFITASRWAMANVLLKEEGMDHWLDSTFPSRHKGIAIERKQSPVKEHEGAILAGKTIAIPQKMKANMIRLVKRKSPPKLSANVWHCTTSNKLFAVECNVTPGDEYLLEDVTDSVVCHEE